MTDQAVELPVALHVMDHQAVGPHGDLLGDVDDLVLSDDGGRLAVTGSFPARPARGAPAGSARRVDRCGVATTPPGAAPRPPGRPVGPGDARGCRRHRHGVGRQALAEDMRLEFWLRRHVVARLPGARGGERRLGGLIATAARPRAELSLAPTDHLLSGLLGSVVMDDRGTELGTVLELVTRPAGARLDVERLVFGRRRLGAELGYTVDAEQDRGSSPPPSARGAAVPGRSGATTWQGSTRTRGGCGQPVGPAKAPARRLTPAPLRTGPPRHPTAARRPSCGSSARGAHAPWPPRPAGCRHHRARPAARLPPPGPRGARR